MSTRSEVRSSRSARGSRFRVPRVLRRRLVLPLVFVLLGLAGAGALVLTTPKTYIATAQVFVTPSAVKDASGLFSGNQFALAKVQSYVDVVDSPDITREVRQELNLNMSDAALAGKITADAPLTQSLLNIHVTDGVPGRAARIANAVARQFTSYATSIDTVQTPTTNSGTGTAVLKLTIVHPAVAPSAPVTPRTKLTLLVGLLAGLTVGIVVLVIRERLDNKVRTAREVDDIASDSVVGVIPKASAIDAFGPDGDQRQADAYRLLRTNVLFGAGEISTRSIAVVSPSGGEGRSTAALNLAAALVESGLRVCLLELDLSNPGLSARLGLDTREPGAAKLLAGTVSSADVPTKAFAGVDVIGVGALPADPHRLLRVDRLTALLDDLAARYDVVVVDAPPLLTSAGGVETVSAAAATLVIARAGRTDTDELRRAVATVSRAGALAGVALLGELDRSWTRQGHPAASPAAPASKNRPGKNVAPVDEPEPDADPTGTGPDLEDDLFSADEVRAGDGLVVAPADRADRADGADRADRADTADGADGADGADSADSADGADSADDDVVAASAGASGTPRGSHNAAGRNAGSRNAANRRGRRRA